MKGLKNTFCPIGGHLKYLRQKLCNLKFEKEISEYY